MLQLEKKMSSLLGRLVEFFSLEKEEKKSLAASLCSPHPEEQSCKVFQCAGGCLKSILARAGHKRLDPMMPPLVVCPGPDSASHCLPSSPWQRYALFLLHSPHIRLTRVKWEVKTILKLPGSSSSLWFGQVLLPFAEPMPDPAD